MPYRFFALLLVFGCLFSFSRADDSKRTLDTFRTILVCNEYYSEGAGVGDFDQDGNLDLVYGPHWYAGPDFKSAYEIYPPVPQNREGYSDHFFAWVYDFDRDGWPDIFTVGFPGTPAHVYQNPGKDAIHTPTSHWKKHAVFDWVSNESPQLIQLVGDDRPELVCSRDGFYGYATIDWDKPFEAWNFTAISAQVTDKRFGHGLGIGDVDGDGLLDVIHAGGWLQQPKELSASSPWRSHEEKFSTAYGGAEMYAYDVDGDGDNDIITSNAAHDFGLVWYEQFQDNGERRFKQHEIMGSKPEHNPYGVVFSELHSVNLADIDGDGLKDIVTGKTYYSHHKASPMWNAGAVVYWFKLVRGPDGVDWLPFKAADETGGGRQIGLFDVNKDGLLDITVGGMKGAHIILHDRREVSEADWKAAQPVPFRPIPKTKDQALIFEGEDLDVVQVTHGTIGEQNMSGFQADRWSGDSQLWWTGAKVGAKLELELAVESDGVFDVMVALTKAPDYGIVQTYLDGKAIGSKLDLYNPQSVISTGVIRLDQAELKAGKHTIGFEIVGTNPNAVKAYMVGLDVVQLGVQKGTTPNSPSGKPLNLDFEKGTLEDWTASGSAFEGQPIEGDTVAKRRNDMRSEHEGKYWIGTFEKHGDQATGQLTSAAFVIDQPFASYLVGGGSGDDVTVEVLDASNKQLIHRSTGRMTENMRQVVVDLRKNQGQQAIVRLTDNSKAGWGHLNFDGFELHTKQPGPITPSDTPMVVDEYPFEGLTALKAAEAMKVPEGFRVIAAAAEPEVLQPIAMALDDRGRVWIAEAFEYPVRAPEGKGRDRILIFEDTDGDGVLDKRKVFAEGLNLISGLEVGFGGVWVGAAPYLLFIPDKNQDDVPDGKAQILLDGWGLQDTHETLNAFIWGPDGWLYGCHGVFTYSRVGKPGTPDKDRQPINAGVWRYHPTRHEFEVFAHGTSNPWGVDFNDHGQAFITACVIPHLYHIIQGGRYERQAGQHYNPHTYDDIKTIADHRHYVGANPHSGNGKSDAAGGGHAHAGAMIYLGNAWPSQYRDQLFMNNIHGQRLNVDALKPHRSGYVGSHAPDFLLTGDKASQILNLRYGPDGQAWMIDWYDMQACHLPDPGKHDRSNGRIYKIVYGDSKLAPRIALQKGSDMDLVQNMLHSNDWFVRHSRRILQERAANNKVSSAAIAQLRRMARSEAQDTRRLRAAWALSAMNQLDAETCEAMLADASEYVRGWAIQLGLESKACASAVSPQKLARLAMQDPSPVVRLYLASAAQRLPVKDRWELVQALASHAEDADDHNLPWLIWYAAEPLAEEDSQKALNLAMTISKSMPMLRNFMLRRIGSGGDEQALATLVEGLAKANAEEIQIAFLEALRNSLAGRRRADPPKAWDDVHAKLLQGSPNVQRLAQSLGVTFGNESSLSTVRQVVQSSKESAEARSNALSTLLAVRDPKLAPILQSLLQDKALRLAALTGLAQYADSQTSSLILNIYTELSQTEKRAALSTLASRADYAIAMLESIEAKRIPASDLSADLVMQLEYLKDEKVNSLLSKTWGTVRETPAEKAKLIEEYKALVLSKKEPKPDPSLGRAVFSRTCQQCHSLFGTGENIGPELTGSNRANLDYVLSNIVDPSSVMAKEYQPAIILTEGRIVTGVIKAEDNQSVTLQKVDGVEVIPLDEIEERKLSEKSLMPEDQLKLFSKHEVRSLVAYLASDRQIPLLATADNAALFFNGKDLKLWRGDEHDWSVESGEIVAQAHAKADGEFLISDMAAENFHLTFEVKFEKDKAHGAILFRGQSSEDGVRGYEVSIGQNTWGKVSDPSGKDLPASLSSAPQIRPGDWNRVEVRAAGARIQTWVNGQLCSDFEAPTGAKRGIIALQTISDEDSQVRFRNLQLNVLAQE